MVKLIHKTENAEQIIAFCARVSSPNQDNPDYEKLISYCIKNKHWSVLEMGNLCVEIKTSRAIAQQILRHRSFHFQEFSQRYSKSGQNYQVSKARRQDQKNRQNSINDLSTDIQEWFTNAQNEVIRLSSALYTEALQKDIAKECARFLLPLNTETKLYMNGTIRDWVHYCLVRCESGTQLEHREIAQECWKLFRVSFPVVAKAVESQNDFMKLI